MAAASQNRIDFFLNVRSGHSYLSHFSVPGVHFLLPVHPVKEVRLSHTRSSDKVGGQHSKVTSWAPGGASTEILVKGREDELRKKACLVCWGSIPALPLIFPEQAT